MNVRSETLRALAPIAALMLVASVVVVPSASAATTYNVQVGQFLGGPDCNLQTGQGCVPGEGQRFYGGPRIRVMTGDTLRFTSDSFHTATLLPKNVDVQSWVADNAAGVGNPWSFLLPDPDDTALDPGGSPATPSLKGNTAAIFPSSFLCGSATAPCPHDGSSVTNSGVPNAGPLDFSATIAGVPGDEIWVICLVHTHMRLRVTVTDDPTAVTTQPAIDAARDAQIAVDDEQAAALHKKMLSADSTHTTASGKKVTDVQAGVDTHWIALLAFYPKVATIKKGQTVRFHFGASSVFEDHTASFSFDEALSVFDVTFVPGCDPDGDAGAGPDGPPENEATLCNDPTHVEFDVPPMAVYEQGDGSFNGSGYESSGIRGTEAMDLRPWDLKFTKASSKKGYKYFCLIHGPFMSGRIKVSD
jgi:plastocyanin